MHKSALSERSKSKGFTLVELLVVVSIIAVLSTIGLVIYSSTQKVTRISKRISDLKAVQNALEVYHSVKGSYPITDANRTARSECADWGSYASKDVIPGLVPEYMAVFPADPQMKKDTPSSSCYIYASNGTDYKLFDYNVPEITLPDLQAQPTLWDPRRSEHPSACTNPSDGNTRFAIWNNGSTSRCW